MASGSLVKAMAATLLLLLLSLAAAAPAAAAATVYTVGDKVGWTIKGNPNYTAWAASKKTFHVGDTLLFVYHKEYHNVLQVTKDKYASCSAAAPLATYTTGNDSIAVNSTGHLYFLCGIADHCQIGQKVAILVSASGASSPSAAPSPSGMPTAMPASAPKPSDASRVTAGVGLVAALFGVLRMAL